MAGGWMSLGPRGHETVNLPGDVTIVLVINYAPQSLLCLQVGCELAPCRHIRREPSHLVPSSLSSLC